MEIIVNRIAKKEHYTIGRLYVNGEYVCDTLEDAVRDVKIKHKTAIPAGRYKVAMTIVSPKYSNPKYNWAMKYGGKLPRLLDVPNYEGILIHVGNTANDTSGCLLVGENKIVGQLVNSTKTFYRLMDEYMVPARERKEEVWIEIK
jgi:hypothetical protein